MGIAFRPARPGDAAELVGLVEELGYPSSPDAVERRLARLLSEPDQAVFVAEEEGVLRGFVHVQESLSLAVDPVAVVMGLVVNRSARGAGLGRALLTSAEEWARARGLASVRLRSRVSRAGAHAFYRRLGYAVVKKQLQFRKQL